VKVGGYVIIEDFFLGNYPADLAWEFYNGCEPQGVYWGPAELGAIFNMVTREVGPYRFFRRPYRPSAQQATTDTQYWFGFTYVLKRYHAIEPVPFLIERGAHYALTRLLAKVRRAAARRGLTEYETYAGFLKPMVREFERSPWVPYASQRRQEAHLKESYLRLRRLYDQEDPFPPRSPRRRGRSMP
jgi:hypothetical protein